MTIFLRLLTDKDKASGLRSSCVALRADETDARVFQVASESFRSVPGAPFAYWVSDSVRSTFERLPAFDGQNRIARVTNPAGDDARFVRAWWEVQSESNNRTRRWVNFSKGGAFSPFFYDVHLVVRWNDSRQTYHGFIGTEHRPLEKPACLEHFFRPGLTWPRRTQGGLSLRVMPAGGIFADKGPAAFVSEDSPDELLALLALVNSKSFGLLVSLQMAFGSYEVGVIQKTPIPDLDAERKARLAVLARHAWSQKRILDTIEETSHAFALPAALRARLSDYDPLTIEKELALVQTEIDEIAFELYGFSEADRAAVQASQGVANEGDTEASTDDEGDDEDSAAPIDQTAGLLSWAVGVAYGRFDWRLATGERAAPAEPEPFDPLAGKSPGMLPDGAAPFHAHEGILVDDQGHPHDLARLTEEVLARVDVTVPDDVRRWLQRDFFAFHLQRYSKSRRKAPIYWPLTTTSGSYTLWVYYPHLTSQTLYTAINDFVEPKLKEVGADVAALRNKGSARTRDDEKQFEALQTFELELIELRDTLLKLAPTYKPNHDDGAQISAAPLWPLFRHKPWQKVLKDTWAKLEKGEYDWANLAMNYWPERVREKCKNDKSLAIAHGLEHLYVEPEAAPKKPRGRKKSGGDE
ncbi:BREX-1 system adenine-specific DNA-methyltransferase PglX [Burkholderia cepacia]|uniref:BREX-1 system adenine-specific DNA-methyltransferase PglX n=1 Tax=Burkholderia cepacia TaxID=292 RepID=UPI001CF3185E|nr:BREX-1 system adenine-specific DNA-methyltransferase PglX [Burkholderia cepacia]MCA7902620.1 BREX-1 system adenine-specific DNA-methyltransferase PglX [Burkholderia cepacia]